MKTTWSFCLRQVIIMNLISEGKNYWVTMHFQIKCFLCRGSHSFNSGRISLHNKAEGLHAPFQINSLLGFIIRSKKGEQYCAESQKQMEMLYFITDSSSFCLFVWFWFCLFLFFSSS